MKNMNPAAPTTFYKIDNPEEFARNMLRLFEEGERAMFGMLARSDAKISPYSGASEVSEAAKTVSDIFLRMWMTDPTQLAVAQGTLARSYMDLWNNSIRRLMGESIDPVVQPEPSDNRFKDPEWSSNPYFDFWMQAYLLTTHWAEDVLHQTDGLDERTRQKAEFSFRLLSSALSPSNFPMTNPEVVRETLATNGKNLVQGMSQLVQDMEKSGDLLKVSQTDVSAFEVGRNACGHRRQDRLPERPLPAHPVRANDRQGARGPPSRRAAMDQQVLRPRSHAGEELHQVRRRSGTSQSS